MTLRLLHFSDPHVQLRDWRTRPLRAFGPLRALATVELWKGRGRLFDGAEEKLRAFARLAAGYDHAVCTGDLTQLGMDEEMALARAALEPLAGDAARFTCIAGNHDRYPEGGRAQRRFEERFPEQLRSDLPAELCRTRLLGEEASLVCFDTNGAVSWPVVTPGFAPAAALAQLARTLAHPEVRRRCALVLAHHAPLRAGGRRDRTMLLAGPRLLRACAEGGAQAVLCGHIHERYEVAAAPGRARLINAGSSTELGKEGAWELVIRAGRLEEARAVPLP